jgi:hypothetical protein
MISERAPLFTVRTEGDLRTSVHGSGQERTLRFAMFAWIGPVSGWSREFQSETLVVADEPRCLLEIRFRATRAG